MNRLFTVLTALLLGAGLVVPGQAVQADDGDVALSDTTDTPDVVDEETDDGSNAAAGPDSAAQEEPTLDVSINGSLRFNALFRAYGEQADKTLGDGGFTFDTFRIGTSGSYGSLIFDAEYAVYPESFGGLFIHHGWAGYEFSENRQVQVGVTQVPFGIQPYASSSWFFNSTYYVGLEDDYDAGIKAIFTPGNWVLKGAYYANAEQTDFFAGSDFGRYSYDVVPISGFPPFSTNPSDVSGYTVVPGGNGNRSPIAEANQFNVKVAYRFDHGDLGSTKVGVSGQRGQLKNLSAGATDWHAAYALHVEGRYGGFDAKLEFAQQELNPPLTSSEKAAFNDNANVTYAADDFVVMGAYDFPQRVASEHSVYSSSLAYHIPVNAGPISEIKPYYDFSMVTKNVDGWNDNVTHDVGFLTSAGPMFIYTDLNISKGHPFNHPGANFASVMAENNDNTWRTAFNVNIGIYF